MMLPLLSTTVMVVVLGFVVDTGSLYRTKIKLQEIADAAAASGVLSASNSAAMISAAVNMAAQNAPSSYGTPITGADVKPGFYNSTTGIFTAGAQPYNAIKVVAARAADHNNALLTFFGKALGKTSSDVRATSYAVRYGGVCVTLLGTSGTDFTGSGHLKLNANCPMQVNANASTNGTPDIQVPYACVGGTSSGPGWPANLPVTGCGTLPDPLASVKEPTPSQCNYTNATLSGTLSPGIYCFTNNSVNINGNQTVTGSGVALYFDANSPLTIRGGANVSLTAPTTGPLAGIALFQTRTPNASSNTFTLGGNGTLSINGLIYLPASNLVLNGTGSGTSSYAQIVASTMNLSGTPTYAVNAFGSNQISPATMIPHASMVIPN